MRSSSSEKTWRPFFPGVPAVFVGVGVGLGEGLRGANSSSIWSALSRKVREDGEGPGKAEELRTARRRRRQTSSACPKERRASSAAT